MSSKTWSVRAVEDSELIKFASKLQSALNRMERLGFTITVDQRSISEGLTSGKFVALVTGHGEAPAKKVVSSVDASLPVLNGVVSGTTTVSAN